MSRRAASRRAAALFGGAEEERRQPKDVLVDPVEELGLHQTHPGVDEGRDTALGTARQPAIGRHREVPRPVDADAGHARRHEQQDIHVLGVPIGEEAGQRWSRPFDPQRVRVADEERVPAEAGQDLSDAAALVEQLVALVRNRDGRGGAAREMSLDLVGAVMDIDDGPAHAGVVETVEHMVQHGSAADRDEGLRDRIGDGPHARPHAGREHHRGVRNQRRHGRLSPGARLRPAANTIAV